MRLIANKPLTGVYGSVIAGQAFDLEDATALQLIRAGHARRFEVPRIHYETKVIAPEAPQVSAREPFRDMSVSNPQQTPMAPESDSLLPPSDLSQSGAIDRGGRGRRPGPDTRR